MKQFIVIGLLAASVAFADDKSAVASKEPPVPSKDSAAPASDGPVITFDSTRYDFGTVEPGALKATFKVRNTGTSTLEIKDVKPGCGCTVVPDYDKKIEPGKEGTIKAELNASTMRNQVEKHITVTSNDPKKHTVQLTIAATIKVDLNITPQSVWLGRLRPETETNHSFEVQSALPEPLVIEDIQSSAPWLLAKLVDSKTNSARIQVSTKPPMPYGQNSANVTFHTKYAKYSNVVVRISANVPATIQAVPASLIYAKGESKTIGVLLMRNDGKEFRVKEIKNPSPLLQSVMSTNVLGKSYRLNITYAPQNGKQPDNGRIEVVTDEPEWPKVDLPFEFR